MDLLQCKNCGKVIGGYLHSGFIVISWKREAVCIDCLGKKDNKEE